VNARERALEARAATLGVQHDPDDTDDRRWVVDSATNLSHPHAVYAPHGTDMAAWVCDCMGGRSRCTHKRAVARAMHRTEFSDAVAAYIDGGG